MIGEIEISEWSRVYLDRYLVEYGPSLKKSHRQKKKIQSGAHQWAPERRHR